MAKGPEQKWILLAVGNPDFGPLKVKMDPFSPDVFPSDETIEKAKKQGRGGFSPLPYSEPEIDEISRLVRRSEVLKKSQATEKQFKQWSPKARSIHIATHNILDTANPFYSKIVFAAERTSGEPGYLYTYEIFDLPLNAELVFLSACETESGSLQRGEGLQSVSRAFRIAGAPALVATQWQVSDGESTIRLSKRFYELLIAGLDKRRALQQAKLELIKDGRYDNPFLWAPFILIGDTNPVSIQKPPFWMVLLRIEPMPAVQVVLLGMASWLFLYAIRSFYKELRKSRSRPIRSASERLSRPS